MAPVNVLWRRSHSDSGSDDSTTTTTTAVISLNASVGIAVGFAFLASALLAAAIYCHCNRQRPAERQAPSVTVGAPGRKGETIATRPGPAASNTWLDRVTAVFSAKSRRPREARQDVPTDSSQPRRHPDPITLYVLDEEADRHNKPASELEGSIFGDGKALSSPDFSRGMTPSPSPFSDSNRQTDTLAPSPSPSSFGHRIGQAATAHGAQTPTPSWNRKRNAPPPPLTIAPPVHSRSTSDDHAAYAPARSPYDYNSLNTLGLPSAVSTEAFAPSLPCSAYSMRSSDSIRSSQPLRRPISPQSLVSAPSVRDRSNSGARRQDSQLPAPPVTPTFQQTQTRRIPEDVTEFVCLGPLPDGISMPSPDQFCRQKQARSPPRPPSHASPSQQYGEPSPVSTRAAGTNPTFIQDPLLHETDPFGPRHSPASMTFSFSTMEQQAARDGAGMDLFGASRDRRPSTDSLGSNFTVEEEARIQAQIVKNLETRAQGRVGGGDDIVHIPQISVKRYSWED